MQNCGFILFTIYRSRVYVLLVNEDRQWGTYMRSGDDREEIVKLLSDDLGIVTIDDTFCFDCSFDIQNYSYHFGLIYVPYREIVSFNKIISGLGKISKMFTVKEILYKNSYIITKTTYTPVMHYWTTLQKAEVDYRKMSTHPNTFTYKKNYTLAMNTY